MTSFIIQTIHPTSSWFSLRIYLLQLSLMMKELWICVLFLLTAYIEPAEQSELPNSALSYASLARQVQGSFNVWYNEAINVNNPFSMQFTYTRTKVRFMYCVCNKASFEFRPKPIFNFKLLFVVVGEQ